MNLPPRPPGRDLDALLATLPRDLPPARDLWAGIDAAISPPAARPARRVWPYGLAAGLATLGIAVMLGGHGSRVPLDVALVAPRGGLAAVATGPRAVEAKESEYQATRVALRRTYEERMKMLAPATRARIAADLASIRRAQEDIRHALSADPGSRVLLRLYESTTQQEFDLYSIVGRNTEPVATRTRT